MAQVLARALTSVARVTFPCSHPPVVVTPASSTIGDDLIRVVTRTGIGGRIVGRLRGTPADITLVSTRRPETAVRLFDDEGFPWWMQGQVVLLSEPDVAPLEIDQELLLALSGDAWTTHAASLAAAGIAGIVRPGVDGDVAGLLTLTDAFEQECARRARRETRRAAFEWAMLTEEAFALT